MCYNTKVGEYMILDNLNEEQKKPALATQGAVLVTAGAGSGKTRLLTHRIAYLVQELNVAPYRILAITFTNKAANEMKERLSQMISGVDDMQVSTFHAMCTRMLRRDAEKLGYTSQFSIYGDQERDRVLKRFIAENQLGEETNVNTLSWHISNAKNKLQNVEAYAHTIRFDKHAEIIIQAYQFYERELQASNALDFDDLLVKTYILLRDFEDVRTYYQNRFLYIHVDEFQDTNQAQYEIVRILAQGHGNIFVVGDEDQCIYTWRGAEVENIQRFLKDYPNAQVFKLEQNYRSTKKILEKANMLIKNNSVRLEKNLWTENEEGVKVEEYVTYNDIEEAEYVAQTISTLLQHGYKNSDIAILMRVNAQSRILEEKLLNYNLSHQIYGGFKFFERKEIKDTLAYLRIVANPNDTDALTRAIAFPKRGIGDASVQQLYTISQTYGETMHELILTGNHLTPAMQKKLEPFKQQLLYLEQTVTQMPMAEWVEHIVGYLGIKEAIGSKTEEDLTKQLNVDDFVKSVKEFADANTGAEITDYLQSITLMRDIDTLDETQNYISVMTVHASKGLEFPVVFIVGLNEGVFPLSRAIKSNNPSELEEERRLMYVAVTRAEKRLYLTRSRTRFSFETHSLEYTTESRFLKEMGGFQEASSGALVRSRYTLNEASTQLQTEALASKLSSAISASKPQAPAQQPKKNYALYKTGVLVTHPTFGKGEITLGVTDFVSLFVTVKFETVGVKTLSLKFAPLEIIENEI